MKKGFHIRHKLAIHLLRIVLEPEEEYPNVGAEGAQEEQVENELDNEIYLDNSPLAFQEYLNNGMVQHTWVFLSKREHIPHNPKLVAVETILQQSVTS